MPTLRSRRLEKGRTERKRSAGTGFTLIKLLVVIAICLIMASFAAPIYSRILARSHEAVLKSDLFTMRQMIRRFTLDNHRPPESLDELVKAGYLSGGLPVDPFAGSNQTWQADIEEVAISPEETVSGVVDVHSGSNAISLEGTPYSSRIGESAGKFPAWIAAPNFVPKLSERLVM